MSFFIVVNTPFNRYWYPEHVNHLFIDPPSYAHVQKIHPYRKHSCWQCNHDWMAPVILSIETQNISGEQTNWCPKCNAKASCSTAWLKSDGTDWEFGPPLTEEERIEIDQRLKAKGLA